MQTKTAGHIYFVFGLILLCLAYLGAEYFINIDTMLSVDEFWFAHRSYDYKDHLPYRDFAPYKTVLGYYLLLAPMSLNHGIIGTLIFTKQMIAILNAFIFFITSLWLSRFFSRTAILASLALLMSSDVVLSFSTNIRVDLLAYWLCFFSLLLLLEKRYLIAGILIGLGFATSQKALWYILASNAALFMYWMMATRDWRTFWGIVRFNLFACVIILLYIAGWSYLSNWHTVFTSMFSEAAAMYHLDWYNSTRQLFWSYTLTYNPLLFLLCPLTLVSLFVTDKDDRSYPRRLFVITYAFTILLCLIPYKQVFPYYMQVTIPVFFILYAAFFTWVADVFKPTLAIALLLLSIICVFGLAYPLTLFTKKLANNNGAYQKANIEVLDRLLQEGGDYVAGIDLLYNKSQPIAGMKHLMGPAVSFLYTPTRHLKSVMLPSLDEDPNATIATVISALEKSDVKVYVNNYRMHALPSAIKAYLANQYEHWWGSIYLYAPLIPAGKNTVHIKFTGNYLIESNEHPAGSTVYLLKGQYTFMANNPYRLKLIPAHVSFPNDHECPTDLWEKLTI